MALAASSDTQGYGHHCDESSGRTQGIEFALCNLQGYIFAFKIVPNGFKWADICFRSDKLVECTPIERNFVLTDLYGVLLGDSLALHSLSVHIGIGIDIQVLQSDSVVLYRQFQVFCKDAFWQSLGTKEH
jgi:hypothetical protein